MLPESRLPMRRTREILRLHFESHLVPGQIASISKVSRSTVQRCLERLRAAGLGWPLPADLDDAALERRLYPPPPVASPDERMLPDCAAIHKELKSRQNVTLQLLWEEYRQANPQGYAYSWYCELYREWKAQHRLHKRYMKLGAAGKHQGKIITAVARELLGFIWAIGIRAEMIAGPQAAA